MCRSKNVACLNSFQTVRISHLVQFILSLFLSLSTTQSWADIYDSYEHQNIIDLKEAHLNLMLKALIGSYQSPASGDRSASLATVSVEGSQLILWTQTGKNPISDFQLDLENLNTEITTQYTKNKLDGLYTKSIILNGLEPGRAFFTKTYSNKSQMTVSEASLSIEDKTLVFTYKRTFFKRANIFHGSWVEDKTRRSLNVIYQLTKISSNPIHRADLAKMRMKSSSNFYLRVSKANSVQLNELIRNEFEDLHQDKKAFALALQKLARFNNVKVNRLPEPLDLPPYSVDTLYKNVINVEFDQFNICAKYLNTEEF